MDDTHPNWVIEKFWKLIDRLFPRMCAAIFFIIIRLNAIQHIFFWKWMFVLSLSLWIDKHKSSPLNQSLFQEKLFICFLRIIFISLSRMFKLNPLPFILAMVVWREKIHFETHVSVHFIDFTLNDGKKTVLINGTCNVAKPFFFSNSW